MLLLSEYNRLQSEMEQVPERVVLGIQTEEWIMEGIILLRGDSPSKLWFHSEELLRGDLVPTKTNGWDSKCTDPGFKWA